MHFVGFVIREVFLIFATLFQVLLDAQCFYFPIFITVFPIAQNEEAIFLKTLFPVLLYDLAIVIFFIFIFIFVGKYCWKNIQGNNIFNISN